ncbi:MAG: peptidyl-prolyl cis-trans isomerase [Vicinamibacterales bacterium]
MTMLDRMRRHKSWLKWSLGAVVVTFVLLYVPQFMNQGGAGAAPNDVVATVNGRKVTANVFQRAYNQQLSQIRSSYGDVNDDMLRQLQLGPRLIQQLVNQEAVIAEADRLGVTVSDGELRERLVRLPPFQENGQFVGEQKYRLMLDSSRPPVKPAEFEQELRQSIMAEKLQAAVTGWIRVTDADIEQEYRKRNEKVRLDLAVVNANQFRSGVTATDADVTAEFSAHPDTYKTPEKRRVKYLSIDASTLRDKVTVTPQEVEERYRQNVQTYSTPEQVRASHILFKTEGKDEAAVRKLAETVLAKVKAGGDFAALAKQYSEDDSKASGGDLDFFAKGRMIPEFEQTAWGMKIGETSGLVKSQFGFHIIKVTDKRAAATKTLDEVRPQIEQQVKTEKATNEASRIADEVAGQIKAPADLDKVATARGWTVGDSGLFSRDEPLAGLGFADAVKSEAFRLDKDKVSGQIRTTQGYAFIAVTEIAPPGVPKLDDVKDKVRDAVVMKKAVDLAQNKAAAISQAGANFAAAAKAAGVTVKSTDLTTRGAALPEVGVNEAVDAVAFSLKPNETSKPIATESAVVVVHLRERKDIDPAALEGERETLRTQLTQERRSEFFSAYMTKAMKNMDVKYNNETVKTLLGV